MQAAACRIEGNLVASVQARADTRLDLGGGDRRREQDAALAGRARELGNGQKRLARERRSGIEACTAPIGQQKGPQFPTAVLGDAVRIGEREKAARGGVDSLALAQRGSITSV